MQDFKRPKGLDNIQGSFSAAFTKELTAEDAKGALRCAKGKATLPCLKRETLRLRSGQAMGAPAVVAGSGDTLKEMSHEGIRFVTEEEARRARVEERELSPDAKTPAKVRVHKTEGTGLEIDWKDGHRSKWTFRWLRDACPCATCHDEREKSGRAAGEAKPKAQSLLVMYEAPVRPVEVTPVGKYALKFKWTDGHESGIYSWEYLRRVCQCEVCTKHLSSQTID